jgi:hypothetical protein
MTIPEKKINQIIEMWNDGKSASWISTEVGISRAAVLGKIFRLRNKGDRRLMRGPEPGEKLPKKLPPVIEPEPEPLRENVGIVETRSTSCMYVVGRGDDDLALYCGKKRARKSYCLEHARLCFYVPKIRS